MKIYSGAISSSKSNQPFLFVTKNGSKRKIPLYEPQKVLETALAYDFEKNVLIISYNLLLDTLEIQILQKAVIFHFPPGFMKSSFKILGSFYPIESKPFSEKENKRI
ncbi:hypothetical protein LEP1GSC016_0982 [Leptospira borgpetersenii serovar Hardjo-bovis str. Sponselee]|uniref:Uncharacterized protein n=2 Tax=Leptospira borgpetersenii serovar Hardjo-bovis TaxID=338217 RepID=Q04T30_LEPBJ|nr:Hypothetical protein LBJ_1358 [Leptospira borgpetersenii serovar Hardjo-bovis str. JB197]ABJ79043.1 Hypothetical protein LBL_1583 [Leptospira borgpetersenii serovar Hardjo-bovis str. L550]AMX58344.1 hypothetical protein LBK6_08330 [Leptospira borgpetersenii serovar Hardjo]EMJ78000.1 hypothetical protein LEP1GSC016_0982 [Leptospira borgpetersenii serovar Hardjo-bovis str. Sponselee]AMX61597.1 hypothetical protein LBK9_08360 [Leptospira borgpetersenii serovar Hardjo]